MEAVLVRPRPTVKHYRCGRDGCTAILSITSDDSDVRRYEHGQGRFRRVATFDGEQRDKGYVAAWLMNIHREDGPL